MITRKELKIIKEEELEGDLMDVVDLLMNLRETALEKGYTAIELERYYGDQDGYLSITGIIREKIGRYRYYLLIAGNLLFLIWVLLD